MKLTLTVVQSQPNGAPVGASRAFEARSATVGRGPQNDWVLPDVNAHLSKRHCEFVFEDGAYFVVDTSTNGVFLNGSPTPIGRGGRAALRTGDRIALGEYELEARLDQMVAVEPEELGVDPDDPFGIKEYQVQPPIRQAERLPEPRFDPLPLPDRGGQIIPEDLDLLGTDDGPIGAGSAAWDGPTMPDDLPSERMAFQPPEVGGGGIPDDWMMEADAPVSAPAASPAVRDSRTDDLLDAFLGGAGIDPASMASADPAATMRALGRSFRVAVEGLRDVLESRTRVKSEFRIEQTRIATVNNNPLKFAESDNEAVAMMVAGNKPGYMAPEAAMREAFDDVKAHEMALIAAIEVALKSLLRQMDPKLLEKRLDKQSLLASLVPAARKARTWELYMALYAELASELEDDFQGAFGKAFAEAYEGLLDRRRR